MNLIKKWFYSFFALFYQKQPDELDRMERKIEHIINPFNAGEFRNLPCPCGNGKKTKKCHGYYRYISMDTAQELYDKMAK